MLRSIFKAPKGKKFFCADFSSIEARLVLWFAGEEHALNLLRRGACLYMDMASKIYGEPVTDKKDPRRSVGKQVILACGFGQGAEMFQEICATYGIYISLEEANRAIQTYRTSYAKVPALWSTIGNAFIRAMQKGSAEVGKLKLKRSTIMGRDCVTIKLLSGRYLFYWEPKLEPGEYGPQITVNLRLSGGVMGRRKTWGGDIFQDIIQGTARDLMVFGTRKAREVGFIEVVTVHDETLALNDETAEMSQYLKAYSLIPAWAKGCPIESSGWSGYYYRKD